MLHGHHTNCFSRNDKNVDYFGLINLSNLKINKEDHVDMFIVDQELQIQHQLENTRNLDKR